jgi:hypothetical protein
MIWHLLNEYEIAVYQNIEKLDFGKWYRIDPLRPDRNELIIAIKKRIDMHYDCSFDNENYNWFMRCSTFGDLNITKSKELTYWSGKVAILSEEGLKKLLNSPQVKADIKKSREK